MNKKICLLLALVLAPPVNGQSINGRFSTSVYTWESNVTESTSQNHARVYQTAQFTVGQLAQNRLSVHFYGLLSQDLAESAEDDPLSRVYETYLQWRESKGVLQDLRLGRQRIYSGVAYGAIDGADVTLRIKNFAKVGAYVGILVPLAQQVEFGNWDEGHAFGFDVSTNKLAGTKLKLSFMQRNREPVAYSAPGRYTGRVLTYESLEQRLIGLDAQRQWTRKLSTYGRLDYDLAQERVRRGQFEFRVTATQKLALSAEFIHRAPLLEANSIFTVFEQHNLQDVGLRASYRIQPQWFLSGNFGYQKYESDESVRCGLGLRSKYGMFGYNFRKGYGGQNNGAYVSVNYPVAEKLTLLASTGLSRYVLFDDDYDAETSLTGSVGVNYRPQQHISFDILGQGIRNRFVSNDYRLFVKASYWFFRR